MMLPRLSNTDARRIFLHRHHLSAAPTGKATGDDLLDLIKGLGFVQLDSINTVARAHDLILFSRRHQYRPKALKHLFERDKTLFEHWTHDAAVIPVDYYPNWHLRRQRDVETLRKQWRSWRREGFEQQLQNVLDQIRVQGPMCAGDVGKDEKKGSGGWWDWHPSKTALEYLWRTGALHVVGRENFQKYYDLTENALTPTQYEPGHMPDEATTIAWCCDGALSRLGFATHTEIAAFWAHLSPAEAKAWCLTELKANRLITIEVEGADGTVKPAYARPDILQDPARDIAPTSRLRVLSPFDPALRDRKRAERLFGFDYRVEMFVPAPKRRYGYYVFPILQGDKLVGRVDMKAFRTEDTLRVKALWPERKINWGPARIKAFEREVDQLTKLAGVSKVEFEDGWLRPSADHQF